MLKTKYAWLAIFVPAVVFVYLLDWYIKTASQRDYVRMEIRRSLDCRERRHWKKELLRLNLSVIPFLGDFIYKIVKRKIYKQ